MLSEELCGQIHCLKNDERMHLLNEHKTQSSWVRNDSLSVLSVVPGYEAYERIQSSGKSVDETIFSDSPQLCLNQTLIYSFFLFLHQ